MRVLAVRLPDRLDEKLRATAASERMSVSALVRQAIETRVDGGAKSPSIEELLAEGTSLDAVWGQAR